MIQISPAPHPSPVFALHRFCRLNPIHPCWAGLHDALGAFAGEGVALDVGLDVGEGTGMFVGVFEGIGVAVSLGSGVPVGVSIAVGVGVSAGVFVGVGISAVNVAAANLCTATSVATRSDVGVWVGSEPHAARRSTKATTRSFAPLDRISPASWSTESAVWGRWCERNAIGSETIAEGQVLSRIVVLPGAQPL
jgi:hypothetical protein